MRFGIVFLLSLLACLALMPARPAAAWVITAGFESGNVGQLAQNSLVGGDAFREAGAATTISDEVAHSGRKSCKMVWPAPVFTNIRSAAYRWEKSKRGTNEYYCLTAARGNPKLSLSDCFSFDINGAEAPNGPPGSLKAGRWGIGDNDGLGFKTVYVRLADGSDPDTKGGGYVQHIQASNGWPCRGLFSIPKVPVGGEMWMRAYMYFRSPWSWDRFLDYPWGHTATNAGKLLRFHKEHADGSHIGYSSLYFMGEDGHYGEPSIDNEFGSPWRVWQNMNLPAETLVDLDEVTGANRWHCLELYAKYGVNDGILRMWMDGVLKTEVTGAQIALESDDLMDLIYVMSYWNDGAPQQQVAYIDDIMIIGPDVPPSLDAEGNRMIGPTDWPR